MQETVASTYYLRVVGAKYSSRTVLPRIVDENVRHVLQLTFLSTDCRFAMEMASQDMVSCSILVYICIDYRLHDYNLSVCMWGGGGIRYSI